MAIIVKIEENGQFLFASISGLGVSEEDKAKAISLNELIKKKMIQLSSKIDSTKSRNKVESYWQFGSVLKNIFSESNLVSASEKKLFWMNVGLHAPKELLAKDRGVNRIHIAYCFRLAGYPKNLALKREWSEWVYLFDSPFVNSEERFDEWDKNKIEIESDYTTRENTRMFMQCLNSILRDIDTSDLSDAELIRCYEGAWFLSKKMVGNKKYADSEKIKIKLKNVISKNSNYTAQLMDGKITADAFGNIVLKEV